MRSEQEMFATGLYQVLVIAAGLSATLSVDRYLGDHASASMLRNTVFVDPAEAVP